MKLNFGNKIKFCPSCGQNKHIINFSKNCSKSSGLQGHCKTCFVLRGIAYRKSNNEKNIDKCLDLSRIQFCSNCKQTKPLIYFSVDRAMANGRKNWCKTCAGAYGLKYERNRLKKDSMFRFIKNVRNLIRQSFKRRGLRKNTKTFKILGCSYEQFLTHLSSQFKFNWTFENHGKVWHIDHIIPLATAKTTDDVLKLCHYSNLQPLLGSDNMHKHDKLNFRVVNVK